jgi:hypothetical protein
MTLTPWLDKAEDAAAKQLSVELGGHTALSTEAFNLLALC